MDKCNIVIVMDPVLYEKKGRIIERNTGMGLYKRLAECLLQYVFRGKKKATDKIVVVLGSLYTGEKKSVILQTLKHFLKKPCEPLFLYLKSSSLN